MKESVLIIAEAGVNHNGSEELAFQLIESAAECGADAVKFQTFKADSLVSKGTKTADYQKTQTGEADQYSLIKNLELSYELHQKLFRHCQMCEIEFMSTPFDTESADFLKSLGVSRIKIPSGELTNIPLLKHVAAMSLPMILSTGMADMQEIEDAVSVVKSVRAENKIAEPLSDALCILHCTSNYPTKNEDVNLRAMRAIAENCGLPVGYSDHTLGTLVSVAAVAAGAAVIEKHFTVDRNLPGPDHQASLTVAELRDLIDQIRMIETCMGDGIKKPRDSELPVRELVRRSVVITKNSSAGDVLSEENMALLRPASGIEPKHFESLIGKRLLTNCLAGELLSWADIESA
ncbi:MAG: N-acetylneuraminate synthase [Pseudomonadota bacterium]